MKNIQRTLKDLDERVLYTTMIPEDVIEVLQEENYAILEDITIRDDMVAEANMIGKMSFQEVYDYWFGDR